MDTPPPLNKRLPMVAWYSPRQLLSTAADVVVSTILGRHSDYRAIEALGRPDIDIHNHLSLDGEAFWLDYVADVGDGWNSTYAVAYYLSRPTLTLKTPEGGEHETQRGQVLVFGGDEVYPVPGRDGYRDRLVAPYETALKQTQAPHPSVYAIPGNHDWYDSLVSFTRLFCNKPWFAGWRAEQRRSYFALRLPHDWWLLGSDIQLGSDIDDAQVDYFRQVAARFGPDDRVILCNAEPHWVLAKMYGDKDPAYNESNLEFLEQKVLGRRIAVFLAGDLHHYRRHADAEGIQKITAGGGGAFLHPTHGPDVEELDKGFHHKTSYPLPAVSRRLAWGNLKFPFLNPGFSILPAILYLLLNWSVGVDPRVLEGYDGWQALSHFLNRALLQPQGVLALVITLAGFILFTDTHSKWYRGTAGSLHACLHMAAACLLGWGIGEFLLASSLPPLSTPYLLCLAAGVAVSGAIVGSFIMGLYLLVSLNVFRRHSNEAFSSLGIADWKNFLRLKIEADGSLHIYPVGMERVPRKWREENKGDHEPALLPDDPDATLPILIEEPVTVALRGKNLLLAPTQP